MEEYDHKKIEKKWQDIWQKTKIYQADLDGAIKPFYNLMMFPYPSAEGLHIGNMYAFAHSDAYGRFMRLKGFDVFEPIGLDGFGIHSENYAIKIKEHIKNVSKRTEKHFYKQLHMIGNQYDWSRKVETYKPEYYKWTQWLFLQMYKKGLAYRGKSLVNWCPGCKTVLSDEQVISGACERCSTPTEKREMEQWFFKITDYAEKLLENLSWIDWSEEVKIGQRNWIGKSEGAELEFRVSNSEFRIKVYTTRLDTIFGCTYCVVAPEHPIIKNLKDKIKNYSKVEKYVADARKKTELERTALQKEKTGVELEGIKVINPFNNEEIPLFVADYVLGHYGTGAVMAVSAHDERDFEFAKKYKLSIRYVIHPTVGWRPKSKNVLKTFENIFPEKDEKTNEWLTKRLEKDDKPYINYGKLINSGKYTGLYSDKAIDVLTKWLEKEEIGKKKINYKIRDWCVSRQRYWGPPIPMIFCKKCGWQPVPEKDLPVFLPELDNFLPDGSGKGPLNKVKEFVNTTCPKCKGPAERETDVSDPFVDSCWYFLRYPCTEFRDKPFDKKRLGKWMPVDMYIGGKEHTVLHLLYSRFVAMVLHELDYLKEEEPFKRFFAHGLLISRGAKISKSKGNIVNPDEYIDKFGADTVRLYLMFLGDVRLGGDWRDSGINGMSRFVNRVWKLASDVIEKEGNEPKCLRNTHKTIKKVTDELESLKFNTAIAAIMEYVNYLREAYDTKGTVNRKPIKTLAKLLAPFAPHIAEELWQKLGHKELIFKEKWPEYDPALIKDEEIELVIQINGKLRDRIKVSANISEDEAKKIALKSEKVKKFIGDKKIKKTIFVKGKLINIVI